MRKVITLLVTSFLLIILTPVDASAAETEEEIEKDNKLSMHQLSNHKSNVEELEMIYIDEETVDMTNNERDFTRKISTR
ncbi:hypothetical protein [Oceanobacillus kimchii]|uniref:hypothetical protein n=1 Tax=Oceanobacillus kimchii TaxID=746691 RepID=UPI000348E7D5|nr:hypothetical protein [Oceanobacillus kimchii]